ncbi:astakine-like [Ischnura elegans]|uniref:astakine-like n=1 Tax=Ischnura elegans TaxID=197161 RepID=UPI001ED8B927|nr:astakine-like [Ischnura elegans]
MAPLSRVSSVLFLAVLALGSALVLVSPPVGARPSYVMCASSLDCEEDECCVLGLNRYSIPQCFPLKLEGDTCRQESQMTHNVTLGYPNGDTVDLVGVHHVMCGCSRGLYCNKETATCTKITRKHKVPK